MRRRPHHVRVRSGQFEFVKLNAKAFDWRDTYHLILTLSWPGFAGVVFGVYLLINLVFAALYILDPLGIAEMSSFFDAFFFSVETLATVESGGRLPGARCRCSTGHHGSSIEAMRLVLPNHRTSLRSVLPSLRRRKPL